MALVRNPLAMKLRGKAGAFSYYTESGRQIVRVAQNSSNYGETARRSTAQQRRRVLWANLVNFYRANRNWMRGAYEFKKNGQSDYNVFMSLNMPSARVALTKDMAQHGECIVDSFRISDGSLGSFTTAIEEGDGYWRLATRLKYTQPSSSPLTVGAFSAALISANPWLHNGVQLSLININDVIRDGNRNYVDVAAYELVLDTESEATFASRMPGMTPIASDSGNLHFDYASTKTAVAMIISDSTSGVLKVSSEALVSTSFADAYAFSQPAAVEAAVNSYGVDEARFLDTGYQFDE